MAISRHFYHGLTKKYVTVFGTLFNNILLERRDNDNVSVQKFAVPVSYGPWQKWLAMRTEDPNHEKKRGIQLPRMSYEIVSMSPNLERKVSLTSRFKCSTDGKTSVGPPVPYDIEFNLYIMVKYAEDGAKIIEQIVPFFNPTWVSMVKLITDMEPFQVPLTLTSVSVDDTYENDFSTRRAIIWTLSFTMQAYFFGPATGPNHGNADGSDWDDGVNSGKLIKMVDVSTYSDFGMTQEQVNINVYPGLTEDGQPTTNPEESIPWQQIEAGDDWAFIEEFNRS